MDFLSCRVSLSSSSLVAVFVLDSVTPGLDSLRSVPAPVQGKREASSAPALQPELSGAEVSPAPALASASACTAGMVGVGRSLDPSSAHF